MMPEPIDSVGLDSDDVIFNTFSIVRHKMKATANVMGLREPSDEQIFSCYDYAREMCERLFPEADAAEFLRVYYSLDVPYALVDGTRHALDFLSSSKTRTWIFTGSKTRQLIERRLSQANVNASCFYPIVTAEDTQPHRKPQREAWKMFARQIQNTGIDPRKALYVEDSLENYMRAREIGLQAVLLLGSPNSRGYQGRVPPEDVLPSMRQLPEFVQSRGLVPYRA